MQLLTLCVCDLCSDVPIREFILSLNNSRPESDKFIIEELGDVQLFVKSGCLDWLRQELEKFQDKNTYEVHQRLQDSHEGVLHGPSCAPKGNVT